MPRYLLDTDHLTLLERGHPPLVGRLMGEPPDAVGTSVIAAEEALRGRLGYLARPLAGPARVRAYGLLLGTIRLLSALPILPFEDASEVEYQRLRAQWPRLGAQDLKIAAIALANGVTLLTRNQRDFGRIPGLALADWST
jgi:tRNA(fMet)-specific endonuclease VapC